MMRVLALVFSALTLLGVAAPIDSQIALERYELEMSSLKQPKAMIFTYTVSQAGALSIEQRHRIYRSGVHVRDETLAVDGTPLAHKIVTISKRPDRYQISRIAPRLSQYTMLFLRAVRDGSHLDYVYETHPLVTSAAGFTATRVTIDGQSFLPRAISFRTSNGTTIGHGLLEYGKAGSYWVPLAATVDAPVKGKPTRERITWSDYRFPPSLPPSTFFAAKPLPQATLPPI
ncbi:MAG TPA: hypothetical protein VFN49_08030 [Candidatus Aquilonibacter sp.]|nr:hypothetical protein [Candidatus Aquilonibacter sp.]